MSDIRTTKTNYAVFDGVRGVAAIAIVFFHATFRADWPQLVPNGYLAVDLFFCLSGFVIAQAYGDKLRAGMTLREFARVRLVRLYPLFLLGQIAGLIVFLAYFLAGTDGFSLLKLLLALTAGVLMLPIPVHLGSVPPIFPLNGPSWSLFFEIAINAAYAIFLPRLNKRVLLILLAVSFVALGATALIAGDLHVGFKTRNFLGGVPRVFFSFTAGLLIYQFRPAIRTGNWATLAILVAVIALMTMGRQAWWYDLPAVCLFPLLIWLAASIQPTGLLKAFCHFLGRISYPVYILHMPALYATALVIGRLKLSSTQELLAWLSAIFCILVASALVDSLFDQPLRGLLNRRGTGRERVVTEAA